MPGPIPDGVAAALPSPGDLLASAGASAPGRPALPIAGIGASAGGLEACRRLLDALPAETGMAFVLVQHLDPTHASMMVDLLAPHTAMKVRQAADGMGIAPDHLYVIPPGTYLSVRQGALHLSKPEARHGARLPFDFLLQSLAEACGRAAIAIILSGTGQDGSLGLKAVRQKGGLVIAQDPAEAGFDGMPRSAILTGSVDRVLAVAAIPAALAERRGDLLAGLAVADPAADAPRRSEAATAAIIELLRAKTGHDFTLYKPGTLQRRIERRIGLAGLDTADPERYLDLLRGAPGERDRLAKDLLINVTRFFRDAAVFARLAEAIVPDLVRQHPAEQPLRLWVAGCSTGEETYSLAILFAEAITLAGRSLKLQIFASDADADSVASAREGLYPQSIEAEVAPQRLARFFTREDQHYRISSELRAAVVFAVQDVLTDPPFSRLDLVSCRNLLIYLGPEAQRHVIALFHFALREGGILLLGSSETAGAIEGRFEVLAKQERLYRRIGRSRPGDFSLPISAPEPPRPASRSGPAPAVPRPSPLAELCRRLVLEAHAPAAILINAQHECLYTLGPTYLYLRLAAGEPTHDLLALAPEGLRITLRSALHRARSENRTVVVPGGRAGRLGDGTGFAVHVTPVPHPGGDLMLVCFVDAPQQDPGPQRPALGHDNARIHALEQELAATRAELEGAIRSLEQATEEQKAVNEEALSVNEEYQSTNEELVTSKEELQSLNEELTALNGQLQETLERQRTTANDLKNVLYSTDVATLFLDSDLNIRFFTPTIAAFFNVIASDIGRPILAFNALSADAGLVADARAVLLNGAPIEREIQVRAGDWFVRRILPYRTQDDRVEGVVVTFTDMTQRKRTAKALEDAKAEAELANSAKSRFLAAASHDLRQPLQSLALLAGLLGRIVEGERARTLVARQEQTLSAMTGMLNTLLDINRIEAGTISAALIDFPVADLLSRLGAEFTDLAEAQHLVFRMVPCGLRIHSDPQLLEQMIRNLLANAVKYTAGGRILLGCRRRPGLLSIEIWDTGIGIAGTELAAIFEEYHQIDNAARLRSRGLGLGLSIVQRLGDLMGHRVSVRSVEGKGSVFAIDVVLASDGAPAPLGGTTGGVQPPSGGLPPGGRPGGERAVPAAGRHRGTILVVEDDPDLRDLMTILLDEEGFEVRSAADGPAALDCVVRGRFRPDLVLADYNLPGGMSGLELAETLREKLHRKVPVIILTGDISISTLRAIALDDCSPLNKPVDARDVINLLQRLMPPPQGPANGWARKDGPADDAHAASVLYVVDDDAALRDGIAALLQEDGRTVESFASCEAFLAAYRPDRPACLLIDAYLPGMNGLELLHVLRDGAGSLPAIMMTGDSDVAMAVEAMKAGALDFIEKPIAGSDLLATIGRALAQSQNANARAAWQADAVRQMSGLTARQHEIMTLVLDGRPSKIIAADLGISQRTVENHRAAIMKKTGTKSLPALARLAMAAAARSAAET